VSDDVRRIDPPRPVEVWHDGAWVPALQDAWVRWPDGEWMASVSYVVDHDWGRGKYLRSVPADEVRLPE
jgi:hypothetical protein